MVHLHQSMDTRALRGCGVQRKRHHAPRSAVRHHAFMCVWALHQCGVQHMRHYELEQHHVPRHDPALYALGTQGGHENEFGVRRTDQLMAHGYFPGTNTQRWECKLKLYRL